MLVVAALLILTEPTSAVAQALPFRASTNLVRVDVVVLDREGKAVPNLTAEDFELKQDGAPQAITAIAFVRPVGTAQAVVVRPNGADAASGSPPSSLAAPPAVYRSVAIVVDDLGLSFTSVEPTRKALRRFIDEQRQPDDLVAIIRTGQSQGMLQQFTRNPGLLHAAVDAIRWNALGRGSTDGVKSVAIDPSVRLRPREAGARMAAPGGESVERQRQIYAALGSFGALRAVVDGVGTLPGRKSIVFISEGISPFDSGAEYDVNLEDAVKQVIRGAAWANVVVNAIDPRGLVTGALSASDNTAGLSAQSLGAAAADRREGLQHEQDSLYRLARDTGGVAVVNNNDMVGGLRRALEDQNGYYLLGYTPSPESLRMSDRFYRIAVRVKRSDTRVRARPGFYGGSLSASSRSSQLTTLFSPAEPAAIGLRLTPVIGRDATGEAVVRLLLRVDAKTLAFKQRGEWHTTRFAIVGRTIDSDGEVVDRNGWNYEFKVRAADYEHALADGLLYRNQIIVKHPGFYRIGVAVRDAESGTVGTASQFIEVPDLVGGVFALSSLLVSVDATPHASATSTGMTQPPSAASASIPEALASRVFAPGTRLTYAFEAYNVPLRSPRIGILPLAAELRLLADGKQTMSVTAEHVTPTGRRNGRGVGRTGPALISPSRRIRP